MLIFCSCIKLVSLAVREKKMPRKKPNTCYQSIYNWKFYFIYFLLQ